VRELDKRFPTRASARRPAAPADATTAFDVVVLGASAGGLTALAVVLGGLPATFPVAVALVVHLSPDRPSYLTQVLARHTAMPVTWARHGEVMTPGAIFVAPPDQHLVLAGHGEMRLESTPPMRFSRPSVDRLFVSAARTFGSRTLAVVLTGNGLDGRDGSVAVHAAGGLVIAQDESSSEFFSMPREAIGTGAVALVLPLDGISAAIARLVRSRDDVA
jgi:two-component system chemotaxis response regulator CheB